MSTGIYSSVTRGGQYEPFELQVSRGQISGHSPIYVFGLTTSLGSTAYGPAWDGLTSSGGPYIYPSVAAQMWIYSASASDTAVSILINGLDANYNRISETIALNGTTAIQTVNSYFRINNLVTVIGNAVGNISLYSNSAKTGGTLYAQINAGNGNSQMSIYTVPAGYTLYKTFLQANTNTSLTSGAYNKIRTFVNPPLVNGAVSVGSTLLQAVFPNIYSAPLTYPLAFPEKTDIQWQLVASSGTVGVADIYIGGVLIKNPD
jgi:hypothetical protein